MGPILNTIIGAGIKIGVNWINAWIEQKRMDQMMLAARDDKMMDALLANQQVYQMIELYLLNMMLVLYQMLKMSLLYLG